MSLLESFSEMGALLTIATTHHGELKTLKYRYSALISLIPSIDLFFCCKLLVL